MLSFLDGVLNCHSMEIPTAAVANIALPYFNNLFGFFTYKFRMPVSC
jgi:hypothetical protein